jgi:hypothetical protein
MLFAAQSFEQQQAQIDRRLDKIASRLIMHGFFMILQDDERASGVDRA